MFLSLVFLAVLVWVVVLLAKKVSRPGAGAAPPAPPVEKEPRYDSRFVTSVEVREEGSVIASSLPSPETDSFYALSERIAALKEPEEILAACEKSYELLPGFVSACLKEDGDLPPLIRCRDVGPWLYMKLGRWDEAEAALSRCAAANAFYPADGSEERDFFLRFKRVACAALDYIRDNPGCLQKNVYKALPFEGEDREALKSFLRNSLQIRKEKAGKTNALYLA